MNNKRTRHTNLSTSQCQTEKLVLDLSLSDSIVSDGSICDSPRSIALDNHITSYRPVYEGGGTPWKLAEIYITG